MFRVVDIQYLAHANPVRTQNGTEVPYPQGGMLPHVITPFDVNMQLFEGPPFNLDDNLRAQFKSIVFALQIPADPMYPNEPNKSTARYETERAFQSVLHNSNIFLEFEAQNYIRLGGGQHIMNLWIRANNSLTYPVSRTFTNARYDYKAYGSISIRLEGP